jgi:alanine racemase
MGVVKSNAYGHNLSEFAHELEDLDVDYLAVDSAVEGIALRGKGIKAPILVLGYTLPEMIQLAQKSNIEIALSNFDYFSEIKKLELGKPVKVHIKVDTGMHRHGFQLDEMKRLLLELKKNKTIEVIGLFTHFAAAKNPAFPNQTKAQINTFNTWREAFNKEGIKVLAHASATSGTILFPEAHFDMVRVGIGFYGIWPSRETQAFAEHKFKLKTPLSWKTLVAEVKKVKAGEKFGYDYTEKLNHDSTIAILPIGYWHGYPRALSSIGQVIINGQKAKVVGRICMDIIMVDISNLKEIKVGDEVTIIGRDGKEEITVDDIATLIDGSSYEVVTRINPLIKRIYR